MSFSLRPYQQESIDAAWRYFAAKKNRGVVVLPTGSGKSLTIAGILKRTYALEQNRKFLILAPRQELLEQLEATIRKMIPDVPLGVYCASMKRKETGRRITLGMVNSLHRRPGAIGYVNLVMIDEAQAIPHEDTGMYRSLFKGLATYNSDFRILGFTATPYRLRGGMLTDGFFDEIIHEVSVRDLIEQGFLSRLVSKTPKTQADLSELHSSGGDFIASELEELMDKEALTKAAVSEIIQYGHDRQRWLIFCSGIQHAEHFAEEIRSRGIEAEAISSENDSLFRANHIQRFREGKLRCLVNCQILTVGFDVPSVDLLAMLRPTKSVGLYQQIVGRLLRPVYADGFDLSTVEGRLAAIAAGPKKNGLVLCFSGNVERHGPIDAIKIVRRNNPETEKEESSVSTAPVKVCPSCQTACLISAKECLECGFVFAIVVIHAPQASTAPILSVQPPQRWEVSGVEYKRHEKDGKPPSLRINYVIASFNGLVGKSVSEWCCIQHFGFARERAVEWWMAHTGNTALYDVPLTVDDALTRQAELLPVGWIKVVQEGGFDRVIEFGVTEEQKELREFVDNLQLNIF